MYQRLINLSAHTLLLLLFLLPATAFAGSLANDNQQIMAEKIVLAARDQVGVTLSYDSGYARIDFPGGDIPKEHGVCTDVIIRALRDAGWGDLQEKVNLDMRQRFAEYPKIWGLTRPDANIDHRRVPNLRTYFEKHATSLPLSRNKKDYLPGDIVTVTLPNNLPHIMIVSDKKSATGTPLVIHNIGQGTLEDNMLFLFSMTGHYRLQETASR